MSPWVLTERSSRGGLDLGKVVDMGRLLGGGGGGTIGGGNFEKMSI